jgi:hypothetical protein
MTKIYEWNELKGEFHQGSLLLGNGSSISVNECFKYKSLYEKAKELGYLSSDVQSVFNKFGVNDFELVLRRLWQAKQVNEALGIARGEVDHAYEHVRTALIKTVRETHVTYDEASLHLDAIYKFMKPFDYVISLNYDLIVYWAMLAGNDTLGQWFKDCFTPVQFKNDWWNLKGAYKAEGTTLCFYPHGNLILYRHDFSSERKINKKDKGSLLDAILEQWEISDLAPAFVCEGTRDKKVESISSLHYLEKIYYEVLTDLSECLVVYGWGFSDQDGHIIEQIEKSKVKKVAVSVFGNDQVFCGYVENKLKKMKLTKLRFFNAESENCWNSSSREIKGEEFYLGLLSPGEKIVKIAKIFEI